MFKINKVLLSILLLIIMTIVIIPICYANSAEPPSVLIIVPNAPEDLEISIGSEDTYSKANKKNNFMENYYIFYSRDLRNTTDYTLKIETGKESIEIKLDEKLETFNNIFTLDLDKQTLRPGKMLSRSIILVSLRIILTLIIEAIVFWIFGFRNKRSWISFLIINLMTQGWLNIWINSWAPLGSYLIIPLIIGEIMIFISEIILFLTFVEEKSHLKTVSYVLLANLLSLIAGGYVITVLPI